MAKSKATVGGLAVEEFAVSSEEDVDVDDDLADEVAEDDAEEGDRSEGASSWSGDDDSETADGADDTPVDLDELGAEELEMRTEDELAESLVIDEAAELRELRRAANDSMGKTVSNERGSGEFLCKSCYLVRPTSQLVDRKRTRCVDCAV